MSLFMDMTTTSAAALYIGLLIVVMLGLKMYVGSRRAKFKVPSGESHPEFSRATRVQLNAVEDVPVLMAGILALAALNMPAWYIHMTGGVLVVARLLHAWGLSGSSGFSFGRVAGTAGTMLVYITVAGALLVHAFTPAHG